MTWVDLGASELNADAFHGEGAHVVYEESQAEAAAAQQEAETLALAGLQVAEHPYGFETPSGPEHSRVVRTAPHLGHTAI